MSGLVDRWAKHMGGVWECLDHAVKAEQVATFLGKKLHGHYEADGGTSFHTRIEGTCIKHQAAGQAALKMYDKFGRVLRIETTAGDVGFSGTTARGNTATEPAA